MSAPPDESAGTDAMFAALYEDLRERAHLVGLSEAIERLGWCTKPISNFREIRYASVSFIDMLRSRRRRCARS